MVRHLIRRYLGLTWISDSLFILLRRTDHMTQLVDDLVAKVAAVKAAVDALEAKITVILANSGMDPADKAKIEQAIADLTGVVADAEDGVDEAAPVAP